MTKHHGHCVPQCLVNGGLGVGARIPQDELCHGACCLGVQSRQDVAVGVIVIAMLACPRRSLTTFAGMPAAGAAVA